GAGVEAGFQVAEEVLGADRRLVGVQFDLDVAVAGGQHHMRVAGGKQAAAQQQAGGKEKLLQHGCGSLTGWSGCWRSAWARKSSSRALKRSGWSIGVAWREFSITTRRALDSSPT